MIKNNKIYSKISGKAKVHVYNLITGEIICNSPIFLPYRVYVKKYNLEEMYNIYLCASDWHCFKCKK